MEAEGFSASKIWRIEAELRGVAGAWDFAENKPSGEATMCVRPIFEKQDDDTWRASVRLIGISQNNNDLDLAISFIDNTPATQMVAVDLSDKLTVFNSNKSTPLTLNVPIGDLIPLVTLSESTNGSCKATVDGQ